MVVGLELLGTRYKRALAIYRHGNTYSLLNNLKYFSLKNAL